MSPITRAHAQYKRHHFPTTPKKSSAGREEENLGLPKNGDATKVKKDAKLNLKSRPLYFLLTLAVCGLLLY